MMHWTAKTTPTKIVRKTIFAESGHSGTTKITNVTGSKRPQAASAAPCLAVGYSLRLPSSNDAITRPNSSPEAVNPSNNEAR